VDGFRYIWRTKPKYNLHWLPKGYKHTLFYSSVPRASDGALEEDKVLVSDTNIVCKIYNI